MNILFYVEPVVFRNNPILLSPHLNIIRCFINANIRDDVNYAIATSPWLCRDYDAWIRYGGVGEIRRFPVLPRKITKYFSHDRNIYSKSLFSEELVNYHLLDIMAQINAEFRPDVVICSSQNSYIPYIFGKSLILFFECGPITRWDGRVNYYFDTGGHQGGSIMQTHADAITRLPLPDRDLEQSLSRWARHSQGRREFSATRDAFSRWIKPIAQGRSVAIIANQPPDWVAVEGAYPSRSAEGMMQETLENLPDEWIGVPTYHPDSPRIEVMEQALTEEFPNLASLPEALVAVGSEPFIPLVDGLVTIASKVGVSALLSGKSVATVGRSMIEAFTVRSASQLTTNGGLDEAARARLICFMANRFCLTFEQCFETNGYLLGFIETLMSAASPQAAQLDFSDWSVDRLDNLFGPQ